MMWNWFTKMLGKDEQQKRKKVLIEIPFEQHRFSMDDFSRSRLKFDADDNLPQDGINPVEPEQEVDTGNK
ncbi:MULTISPECIES: hypothetical protein [Shewanella]|uniref:hypothetical protein n=1 Tax=Shewanella TaxID=22 RepID=UPI0021D8E7B1|nr:MULTISPECIES: hypothetical protein [unclassified Shewanella]GCF91520.1 hypothetical protein SMBr_37640 [Shewanella sp. M-Br]MCU8031342.1 hypothetical protein [Shewanella sp. SM73]MCU8055370.1 hypothetical protein [Shewanella sp. SM35]MCU8064292.1 hypothetical protein [Shewanella sp. SM34]MCU8074517.1 hypothetical protein [Shewanella sp. SM29]